MKKIFNNEQVFFIKSNYENYTYEEMSKMDLFFGYTAKQIRNKARNIGIKKSRTFNDKYFENINSKEKAYFLGFIYADGTLVYNEEQRNYELSIEINTEDEYLLHVFNKELGGVHNIKSRKRQIAFNGYTYISQTSFCRIYSINIVKDLINNNIKPNKTKSKDYPIFKNEYFCHFLRGFFDGDGCIYSSKDNTYNLIHFTSSNQGFLDYLSKSIFDIINIKGKIYKEKENKYRLMYYNRADVCLLLEYIYKDSENLRLERKFNKIL